MIEKTTKLNKNISMSEEASKRSIINKSIRCFRGIIPNRSLNKMNMSFKRFNLERKIFFNEVVMLGLLFLLGYDLTLTMDQTTKESFEQWQKWHKKDIEQAEQNAYLAELRCDYGDYAKQIRDKRSAENDCKFYQYAINRFDIITKLKDEMQSLKICK